MRRHLDGVLADSVSTLSAVLVGGAFAVGALLLLMSVACDRLLLEVPKPGLCLFVGDITLLATGQNTAAVAIPMNRATNHSVALLGEELGCWCPWARGAAIPSSYIPVMPDGEQTRASKL